MEIKVLKCPCCGASINSSLDVCSYCGSFFHIISDSDKRELEQNNTLLSIELSPELRNQLEID